MKRIGALVAVVVAIAIVAVVWGPSPMAHPVYSIAQLQAGLTPRHNVWGGHTVWVGAVAALGSDLGGMPDTVVLADHAPVGAWSPAFTVVARPSNLTFALLSWQARLAHAVPWVPWPYDRHRGVYRVRFFKPTWCFSCPVGQLQ
jgi:hypothetical protein